MLTSGRYDRFGNKMLNTRNLAGCFSRKLLSNFSWVGKKALINVFVIPSDQLFWCNAVAVWHHRFDNGHQFEICSCVSGYCAIKCFIIYLKLVKTETCHWSMAIAKTGSFLFAFVHSKTEEDNSHTEFVSLPPWESCHFCIKWKSCNSGLKKKVVHYCFG